MKTVSIFIRTLNEASSLKLTLDALASQDRKPNEVVVLDNESTDDSIEVARSAGAVSASISREDFSYGGALNRALSLTKSEIIVFLSAHSQPLSDSWLDALVSPLETAGKDASYGRQVPMAGVNHLEEWVLYRTFPRRPSGLMRMLGFQAPSFSNANSAVTRELLEEQPFREDLAFAEDKEWAARVQGNGRVIVYCANAAVYHSHLPEGVEGRMLNVGHAMQLQNAGRIYLNPLARNLIVFSTITIDILYCATRGYWSTIPTIRSYRRAYFRGLLHGLKGEPEE